VPSYNHVSFLEVALISIFSQPIAVEVFVVDGGSTDGSLDLIRQWAPRLAGWRSHRDAGQSAAINEAIACGKAPYVAWLNSDDLYLPDGLDILTRALQERPQWPAAYGRAWNSNYEGRRVSDVWVEPFSERRLAIRNIVSQPATLIRREAWEAVGGVDASLTMAFDYDLWWRLFRRYGPLGFVDADVAVNRDHRFTKTNTRRRLHYEEAISVVRRHHGRVPIKWWLAWPSAVWLRSLRTRQRR